MDQTFSQQDYGLLQKHLQAQVEVEFLTVPFYLTAVYSFTQDALNNTTLNWDNTTLYDLQQRTLSVAVQEMYHLQLACNLANAFNVTPAIPQAVLAAGTPITIPHLAPGGVPLTTQLGNLPAVIEAMVEIETPDKDSKFPPPNPEVTYDSISDLYHATLTLLGRYLLAYSETPAALDPNFSPNRYQVAWGAFEGRYQYNKISNRGEVPRLANAITDQGEGHLVSPELQLSTKIAHEVTSFFRFGEGGNVLPEYQPTKGSRFYQYDGLTHYARFEQIKAVVQSPPIVPAFFYQTGGTPSPDLPSWAPSYETVQASLNTIWSYLVDVMQTGFGTGTLSDIPSFGDAMLSVKYLAPLIWQWGYCPSYEYRTGVTAEEAQDAMDAADPLCLFHWDKVTIKIREEYPNKKNTCEGLNQCKGLGWGGLGTQVGDGACATADLHTCQGTNSCKFQGGCAYLSSVDKKLLPTYEQWIPGVNQCKTMGGCQVPIATLQVFDSTADLNDVQPPPVTRLQDLQATKAKATPVWDEARNLLQILNNVNRELSGESAIELPKPLSKQVSGGTDYDGTRRRGAITATSKQPAS